MTYIDYLQSRWALDSQYVSEHWLFYVLVAIALMVYVYISTYHTKK